MKQFNAKDILKVISKQWCSSQDFMTLSCTGKNTTLKLMKELRTQLEKENYFLPTNLLPMDKVVEYLKLNVSFLEKVSDFKLNSEDIKENK